MTNKSFLQKFHARFYEGRNTLWSWICKRLVSLAIGCIVTIVFFMWLRFFIGNVIVLHEMPAAEKAEFSALRKDPDKDRERFHAIIDKWYGVEYSDPSVDISDWILVFILTAISVPIMFFIILRAVRPLSTHISRLAAAARAVTKGNFGVNVDIPEHLPDELSGLTQDINAMSRQLARYDKELKASHVALAHELRSPLTASLGRLQGMIDGVFEPSQAQLQMVMRQLQHLNHLVDDLHLLSLADAGQLHLNRVRCNIADIIREKVAWATPRLAEQAINVRIVSSGDILFLADPFRLGQVFSILMDNAIRYAAEGKRIDISYKKMDEKLVVSFSDYGAGVTDEFLKVLFVRFSRADASRSRHSGGSGLGLSIAAAICEAHGGTIRAEKNVSGGLTFTLFLPLDG